MSNFTSLQSIEFGRHCFGGYDGELGASSFSLIGIIEWKNWVIDFPQLQSVKLGDGAFNIATSFSMSNLPSLQSIDIGQGCFKYAPSFSLTGLIDGLVWIHRSSSTTISKTGIWYALWSEPKENEWWVSLQLQQYDDNEESDWLRRGME